jgi:hypothetical protein
LWLSGPVSDGRPWQTLHGMGVHRAQAQLFSTES